MKKKIIIFLVIIGVSFVGKNFLCAKVLETGIGMATGLYVHIDHATVDIFDASIRVRGLHIYNSSDFLDPVMLDFEDVYCEYQIKDFFRHWQMHFNVVQLSLAQFVAIRNKHGALNIDALLFSDTVFVNKYARFFPALKIDDLQLAIERIVYEDYYGGNGTPNVKEYIANLVGHYVDIKTIQDVGSLLVDNAFMQTSLAKRLDINLSQFNFNVKTV